MDVVKYVEETKELIPSDNPKFAVTNLVLDYDNCRGEDLVFVKMHDFEIPEEIKDNPKDIKEFLEHALLESIGFDCVVKGVDVYNGREGDIIHKQLKTDYDENVVHSFDKELAKSIIRELSASKEENVTKWIPLADVIYKNYNNQKVQFALVFGWENGFDPKDVKDYPDTMYKEDEENAWGLCGKIAKIPHNSMMHEYTMDFEMPVTYDGVWDTDTHITSLSDTTLDNYLNWCEREWNLMLKTILAYDYIDISFIKETEKEKENMKELNLELVDKFIDAMAHDHDEICENGMINIELEDWDGLLDELAGVEGELKINELGDAWFNIYANMYEEPEEEDSIKVCLVVNIDAENEDEHDELVKDFLAKSKNAIEDDEFDIRINLDKETADALEEAINQHILADEDLLEIFNEEFTAVKLTSMDKKMKTVGKPTVSNKNIDVNR